MSSKTIEKDGVIFQEGDIADAAYYITSGKVALFQSDRGQSTPLKTVADKEVFGELCLFDDKALRPYSARALEATTVETIQAADYAGFIASAPDALKAVFQLMADRMKLGKSRNAAKANPILNSTTKSLTLTPEGDKLKSQLKPVTIPVASLPFRIGGFPEGSEVNRKDTVHLSIASQAQPLRVSRQHCEIANEDGALVVVDMGSRFGTIVNGVSIGRGKGVYSAPLANGTNTIILGNQDSGYSLTITCE